MSFFETLGEVEQEIQRMLQAGFHSPEANLYRLAFTSQTKECGSTAWQTLGLVVAIDMSSSDDAINGLLRYAQPNLIVDVVSEVTGINPDDILGESRALPVSEARHIVEYLINSLTGRTALEISRTMGLDRTSVLHGIDKIDRHLQDGISLKHNGDAATVLELCRKALADKVGEASGADQDRLMLMGAIATAVTADGMYTYPISPLQPWQAEALGVANGRKLIALDWDRRTISDDTVRQYGAHALSLLTQRIS